MKKKLINYALPIAISLAIAGCDFFPDNVLPNKNKEKRTIKLEEIIPKNSLNILDNYGKTEDMTIEENDTYLKYARNLQKKYDNLKQVRSDEIYRYLKYKLNDGKNLITEKRVKLPVYN